MKRKASPRKPTASSRAEALALADRLHSAAIHLLRRLRRVDEDTGLTAPKLSALSVIVFAGPVSLGELAAAEQVRPPTMTHLVRQLQRAGLVRIQADVHDRRVRRIEATAAGSRLLQTGRSRRVSVLADWLGALAPSELATLRRATELLGEIARPAN